MATWAGFLTLVGCRTTNPITVHSPVVSGPLEIHCSVERTASHAWYNLGGKPGGENVTSYFSVSHKGKPVSVEAGTKGATWFWQALFLKDAPRPSVLAGSFSMYLITDDNRSAGAGQASVKLLDKIDNDNGKYQWLDSENGQPGPQHQLYLIDDSRSSRFLSGGRYLMVNTRTVLDVQTLATYRIDNNTSALIQQLDGFNAFGSRVVYFSPKKTQLVLIGYRRNPSTNHSEYALVPIDFAKNQAYAIPFDRTATRFFSIWDVTPAWIDTYFDWTTDAQGREKLSLHPFRQLPYWMGRWECNQSTGQPTQYQLRPVLSSMVAPFMACIGQLYPIHDVKTEETDGQIITDLKLNDIDRTLYFNKANKTLTLTSTDTLLIRTVGEQFDKELAKGRFQEHFGRFDTN